MRRLSPCVYTAVAEQRASLRVAAVGRQPPRVRRQVQRLVEPIHAQVNCPHELERWASQSTQRGSAGSGDGREWRRQGAFARVAQLVSRV